MFTHRAFHYPFYKVIENYIKYANTTENPVYLYKVNCKLLLFNYFPSFIADYQIK